MQAFRSRVAASFSLSLSITLSGKKVKNRRSLQVVSLSRNKMKEMKTLLFLSSLFSLSLSCRKTKQKKSLRVVPLELFVVLSMSLSCKKMKGRKNASCVSPYHSLVQVNERGDNLTSLFSQVVSLSLSRKKITERRNLQVCLFFFCLSSLSFPKS